MPVYADNLSRADRPVVSTLEEPTVFMVQSKVEAILRREKNKVSMWSICLSKDFIHCRDCSEAISGEVHYSIVSNVRWNKR